MSHAPLLRLVSELTRADGRLAAAQTLARALGGENLLIFLPDPEVDAVLPAPGFAQTLPRAGEWRDFLDECQRSSPARGHLFFPDDATQLPALGVPGGDGSVLVLLGGEPQLELVADVASLLPLVAAALGAERLARVAAGQAALARQAAHQSTLLAASLDRARHSLHEALADAEAANKAKDDFLAALSHELRTPLSPVLMTATAMELDSALSPDVREQAGIIRRNAELEARLIDDLLDLTRISHGKLSLVPGTVDVHTLLSQTDEIVRSEGSGKRVAVEFSKEAAAHHVRGDSARLQQVFWNIIKNAVKFTPPGGQVRIVTTNRAGDDDGKAATKRLIVRVTDTGIGIEADMLPCVFNAFEQGGLTISPRFGGLGLGLAIARAIVELHGGAIWAESEGRNRGATFTVELNTVPPPKPSTETGALSLSTAADGGSPGRLRILFVEDHDSTRDVLARILRRSGHEVHVASSGAEALEAAATVAALDVVISDIGLPDQSGFDLMRAIRAKHGLPGIALSGYGMEEDVKNARAAGFHAHLVKPVNFDQLRALLDQVAAGTLR